MIPDSLFSPSPSPVFVLLRVLVSSFSESLFRPLKVLFPPLQILFQSFSESRSRPLPSSSVLLKVLSPPPPIPVPILSVLFPPLKVLSHPPRFPFPSSTSPAPIISVLFPPLRVLSPLPSSQRKQRNGTKPSRRSRGSFQNGTLFISRSSTVCSRSA